jgi:hypothetical protein
MRKREPRSHTFLPPPSTKKRSLSKRTRETNNTVGKAAKLTDGMKKLPLAANPEAEGGVGPASFYRDLPRGNSLQNADHLQPITSGTPLEA